MVRGQGTSIAIIGIIGVIIAAYLYQTGFFSSADIRFVRQPYTDNPCPSSLNTYSGEFGISFSNVGNKGTDLSAELQSPNIISFTKGKDSINLPATQTFPLTFVINTSSLKDENGNLIENTTILIKADYNAGNFGGMKTTNYLCEYKKEEGSLKLIKQTF